MCVYVAVCMFKKKKKEKGKLYFRDCSIVECFSNKNINQKKKKDIEKYVQARAESYGKCFINGKQIIIDIITIMYSCA